MSIKNFKPTGRGPKGGHSFPSHFGFSGSTGAVKQIGPYTRRNPMKKALGGKVNTQTIGDQGNSATIRKNPVTQFDSEHGGKGPLRPGFSRGGKSRRC